VSFPPPPESRIVPPNLIAMLAGLMNKKYIHISFHYPESLPELEATHHIQPIINEADDWIKYADNCWIVWSSKNPNDWYEKFKAIPRLKDCWILILKMDFTPDNRAGQLPQWVWDWVQKPRSGG